MNNSYITIIKEKRTALSRKRIPLNQNGCTANFRIGVPFEQNLHQEHHIHTSNFYYQIRRLRQKACEIPEPVHSSFSGKQEVVPLSFEEPAVCPSSVQLKTDTIPDSVIKITYHSFQIEITNAADRETIFHTLSALQDLC